MILSKMRQKCNHISLLMLLIFSFLCACSAGYGTAANNVKHKNKFQSQPAIDFDSSLEEPYVEVEDKTNIDSSSENSTPNGIITKNSNLNFQQWKPQTQCLVPDQANYNGSLTSNLDAVISALKNNRSEEATTAYEVFKVTALGKIVQENENNFGVLATFCQRSLRQAPQDLGGALQLMLSLESVRQQFFIPQNSVHLFNLATLIRKTMEQLAFRDYSLDIQNQFVKAKNSLPSAVRAIVWGEVSLKHVNYKTEYLYPSANDLVYDNDRRYVFTWAPAAADGANPDTQSNCDCWWSFEHVADDKFYIRSTKMNEYLYPALDNFNFDSSNRRIFTWRPGGLGPEKDWYQMTWRIQVTGDSTVALLTFKNEPMYAAPIRKDANDSQRRMVFANIKKDNSVSIDWLIKPVNGNNGA